MRGLSVTALFGFVAYIVSHYLLVPDEFAVFSLLAAAGSMAGFALGEITAKRLKETQALALVLVIAMVVCFSCFIFYSIRIHGGSANVSDIVLLGVSVTFGFFSLTYLMPLAGIVIEKKWPKSGAE